MTLALGMALIPGTRTELDVYRQALTTSQAERQALLDSLAGQSAADVLRGLASLVAQQSDLLQALLLLSQLRIEQGFTYSELYQVDSDVVPIERSYAPALFGVSLTNDGPGTIQYRMPSPGASSWNSLLANEQISINCVTGVIRSMGLRLAAPLPAGTAASQVRVVGIY